MTTRTIIYAWGDSPDSVTGQWSANTHPDEAEPEPLTTHPSVSLRDYFAGQALAGIGTWMPAYTDRSPDLTDYLTLKDRADWAYRQADAMLAARKEQPHD